MTTVGDWLAAQSDLDRLDRELLVCRAAGLSRAQVLARPELPLDDGVGRRLCAWAARRRRGEPLAYIVGTREFRGLEFQVSPAVLVPRPETELLVDVGLALLDHQPRAARVLDLGTGSGAIAVTIAHQRADLAVAASDLSAAALAVAADNARRHGVDVAWIHSDWFATVTGPFHVILSNPPYVADDHPNLPDLRHEPRQALTAGPDGLDAIRAIVAAAPDYLLSGGALALEHGHDQGAAVRTLLHQAGFDDIATHVDLAGLDRVSAGRLPGVRR